MNLFGNASADGAGKLVRNIAVAGGLVAFFAVAAAGYLDRSAQDGFIAEMAQKGFGAAPRGVASVPHPSAPAGGVRYGDVDYMPTASIPASQQKIKNVVSDPRLGLPN